MNTSNLKIISYLCPHNGTVFVKGINANNL